MATQSNQLGELIQGIVSSLYDNEEFRNGLAEFSSTSSLQNYTNGKTLPDGDFLKLLVPYISADQAVSLLNAGIASYSHSPWQRQKFFSDMKQQYQQFTEEDIDKANWKLLEIWKGEYTTPLSQVILDTIFNNLYDPEFAKAIDPYINERMTDKSTGHFLRGTRLPSDKFIEIVAEKFTKEQARDFLKHGVNAVFHEHQRRAFFTNVIEHCSDKLKDNDKYSDVVSTARQTLFEARKNDYTEVANLVIDIVSSHPLDRELAAWASSKNGQYSQVCIDERLPNDKCLSLVSPHLSPEQADNLLKWGAESTQHSPVSRRHFAANVITHCRDKLKDDTLKAVCRTLVNEGLNGLNGLENETLRAKVENVLANNDTDRLIAFVSKVAISWGKVANQMERGTYVMR